VAVFVLDCKSESALDLGGNPRSGSDGHVADGAVEDAPAGGGVVGVDGLGAGETLAGTGGGLGGVDAALDTPGLGGGEGGSGDGDGGLSIDTTVDLARGR
jgi:hypothetical protein